MLNLNPWINHQSEKEIASSEAQNEEEEKK
jgi:hypothetical protein